VNPKKSGSFFCVEKFDFQKGKGSNFFAKIDSLYGAERFLYKIFTFT